MGFHAGLAAEQYDRQYSNNVLIQRISKYLHPFRFKLIFTVFIIIIRAFSESLPAWVVSKMLDGVQTNNPGLEFILLLTGIVILLEISGYVFNYLRRRVLSQIIAKIIQKLSLDAFSASATQDLAFHDNYSSGKIVSRITSDTRDFGSMIGLTSDVLSQIVQSIIIAIILINTEWILALILFALIPILILFISRFRIIARKITRDGMRAMANVNATIKETVSGIAIAKNFRQEGAVFKYFTDANDMSYKVNIHRGLILSIVFPTMRTLGGITTGILIYVGAISVMTGVITAGAWYLFLLSVDRFLMPILNITSYWTQVQTGLSAAERVFALIDSEHSVKQIDNLVTENLSGEININQVCFGYSKSDCLLNDFHLHISPGETLAIVGHTGAGKTSIARLITRFYDFQSGEILIDGINIRSLDLIALRKHMGIVSQVPFLFEGTIEENIKFANSKINRQEILELSRKIGEGEWLENLAEGLDTQVGERGIKLSMGQRQLVALMRVLVQKPAIFILDEATASIDPFTEKQIQNALNLILENSTSILIAHRLSTVKSADRIIVMKQGRIIEEGNHDSLLLQKGHYEELFNTYFRHQSLSYIEEPRHFLDSG